MDHGAPAVVAAPSAPATRRDWTAIYSLPVEAWVEEGDRGRDAGAGDSGAGTTHPWLMAVSMGCSHDHAAEQRVFDMTTCDKLAACAWMRQCGNAAFREGSYARAAALYQRALTYYEYAFPDAPRDQLALNWVRVLCCLNLAACHQRVDAHGEAVGQCRQALSMLAECESLVAEAEGEAGWKAEQTRRVRWFTAKVYLRWAASDQGRGEWRQGLDHCRLGLAQLAEGECDGSGGGADGGGWSALAGQLVDQRRRITLLSAAHAVGERDMARAMFAASSTTDRGGLPPPALAPP